MTLTAVSLFAGVGGFDLAMQRAGVTVTAAVEIDPKARAVLARHFPDTALFPDVTEVTPDELRSTGFVPERGIITGGFPCQDLSVAGRRAGLAGERSGLFWQIVRLVDGLAPRWVVLENVPGLLSSNDGRDMGVVLGALGELGYGWAYRVLDAQHFGVPQRRRRVFIVAGRRAGVADLTGPAQVLLEPESVRGDSAAGDSTREGTAAGIGAGIGSRGLVTERESDVLGRGPSDGHPRREHGREGPDDARQAPHVRRPDGSRVVTGTLSPGAHPGGFNGQDAYSGHLVVVGE